MYRIVTPEYPQAITAQSVMPTPLNLTTCPDASGLAMPFAGDEMMTGGSFEP
jgi:hypothetical protein